MKNEKPGELAQLALKHGSDKWGHHHYCNHYERHLKHLQGKQITMIELGIGGYHYPDRGGAGLKMWYEFFKNATVIGVDLYRKELNLPKDILVLQGSQDDPVFLGKIIANFPNPMVIIEDASHMNKLTIKSFDLLFPKLAPGGIYIIEDIESSWWEEHGFDGCRDNDKVDFNYTKSTVNMCRKLINDVNVKTTGSNFHEIESMHFYENMVIIHKKS